MQGKGLISTVFVLLVLACIYQLSFTWAATRMDAKAEKHAEQVSGTEGGTEYNKALSEFIASNYDKKILGWYTYQDCKEREINLGLDLQGGMSVVMEISKNDLITKLAGRSAKDAGLQAALETASLREGNGEGEFISEFVKAYKEQNPGGQLAAIFSNVNTDEELDRNATNAEVEAFLNKKAEEGFEATLTKLRERIDRFGVAQASLTPVEGQGRIVVELPGVDNPKQVKKLLQATANLEFWESQTLTEPFLNRLTSADKKAKGILGLASTSSIVEDAAENIAEDISEDAENILELDANDTSDIVEDDIVEEVDDTQGPILSRLQFINAPGIIGQVLISDTSKFMEALKLDEIKRDFPYHRFCWSATPVGDDKDRYELYALILPVDGGGALLEGDIIKSARADIDPMNGSPIVSMNMNAKGAKEWAKITTEYTQRNIAVVLDNKVYSAPTIQEPITTGSSRISGSFSQEDAAALASILETGKLPVKAKIVQDDEVGPSLGKESINRGVTALIIGMCLVLFFMIFYYSTSGIVADLALLANVFFVFGILSAWGATLTLPGLAGIVLTVGMAVDANVIIFERIREELAKGKSTLKAIADGYQHSYSAIIDANVTTFIVAFILSSFGLGPVRGFAVVLMIGIFSSLFTAIFLTRLFIDRWSSKEREIKFFTGMTEGAFKNINFDFIGKRKQFYMLSSAVIAIGFASFFFNGFTLGVDFQGGRTYTVAFDQNVSAVDVRDALQSGFDENAQVKSMGSSNRVKITTAKDINITTAVQDSLTTLAIYNNLKPFYKEVVPIEEWEIVYKEQQQKVLATIANDIKMSSLKAGIFALLGIFFYLLFRFRKWQFGAGAIIAVVHDVLIVLAVFSIFRNVAPFSMEIGETFIAAILTVIGYSINDTVVVFDRIREYVNESKAGDLKSIVNEAVRSTLSRTLITSATTLLVLLCLFIAGSDQIKGFAFAILIGVLVGTYSSIFVATPIVIDLTKEEATKKVEENRKNRSKQPAKA
ncbi:MAG: SecD/SecF fusion protein [Limisphaerales bacterium]|jgi:SecD/SecF fusion protein